MTVDLPPIARAHRLTPELWRRWTEWPLVGVGVVFLVTFSIQVIADVPAKDAGDYDAIIWATWAVFVVDYIVNLVLAEQRGRWFLRNLHEAAILALPMLRPLRLLRLLFILRITHRAAGRALRGRVLTYAFGAAVLLTYIAALAVLDAEQDVPGSKIHSIGDAWWWACVTISGIGYGDLYPITLEGRLVGVGLMIGGIAVIGLVAASMASWLIDQVGSRVSTEVERVEHVDADDVRAQLADVTARLERVTQLLEERQRPER
jgi:voltage-gated potassium channel